MKKTNGTALTTLRKADIRPVTVGACSPPRALDRAVVLEIATRAVPEVLAMVRILVEGAARRADLVAAEAIERSRHDRRMWLALAISEHYSRHREDMDADLRCEFNLAFLEALRA
ncbi:MAG: hypothetical protein HY720_24940 [Planctomycetes bacterium]|nr:hypothetical protein [Planctomycetota bacterium]